MKTINQIEVSEITPNIKISDLCKLQDKFPDLTMSFGVELYGSLEHGNTTGIDDTAALKKLYELSAAKKDSPFKTAIHLNYGFADMFNKNRDFHKSKIWDIIKENNVDKVVWNSFTLTEKQKHEFSIEKFWDFVKTKANPRAHLDYYDVKWDDPFLYENRLAYIETNYYLEIQPSVRDMLSKLLNDHYGNLDTLERINGLYVMKSLDEIPTQQSKDQKYNHQPNLSLEAWIRPKSWAGGINSNNIKIVLDALLKKLEYIESIDVSCRSGVMTNAMADMKKIKALMQNANDWQIEINQKKINNNKIHL